MRQKQTVYELTEDELNQEREAAASKAARLVVRDLQQEIKSLERTLRLMRGLVYKEDLCEWLDISTTTINRWGLPPIDGHAGQRNLYWVPDVIRHLRGIGEGDPSYDEAQVAQKRLEEALRNGRDPLAWKEGETDPNPGQNAPTSAP